MQASFAPTSHHHVQPPPHVIPTQPAPTMNGSVHPEDIAVMSGKYLIS